MKKYVVVLLASIAITGTASAASLTTEAKQLEAQYVDAFNNKQGAKIASFYTEDATVVAQDGHATTGRANLAQTYSRIVGHFTISTTLGEVHTLGNGGWALATGVQTFPDGHVVKTHAVHIYGLENGKLLFRVLSIGVDVPLPHKTACMGSNC